MPSIDNMVKGWGPENPEIMIVSDYPSKEEVQSGKALQGYTGNQIGGYLRDSNYSLDKCYKTDFIKLPLSMPKSKKKQAVNIKEVKDAILPETFERILAKEILDVNPNVIISVGELSTNYLTGKNKILKLRGSILSLADLVRMDTGDPANLKPNTRVIPVIHPRDINAKWVHNVYTSLDYSRAVKNRTRADRITDNSLVWVARDAKSLNNWWADRGYKSKFLTFDIETFLGFVTCISFCGDGYEALSVPLIDRNISNVDRALMLRTVAKILRSKIPKVNQNIKYDHHVLESWGLHLEEVAGDTMILGHCIYPELPKGLDFYTSIYTDIPYYKDEGRDFNPKQGWDILYIYNAKDSLSAWQIYSKQIEEAKESGIWNFYIEKVWPCYDVYKRMDDRGIRVDETVKNSLNIKYGEILSFREKDLRTITGIPDLNFNSPKQIQELVYKELKFPEQWKRDKDGIKKLTTDEETLEELILNHSKSDEQRNILWGIIWCRKVYKILNYINVPYAYNGRIHTWSKLTGTKSGRTSMSESVDKIWYRNVEGHPWYDKIKKSSRVLAVEEGLSFQTLPKHGFEIGDQSIGKDIRKMYIPSPGKVFVEGDGGQAEARVVAILAEDYTALDEMERKSFQRNKHGIKDDLHAKTAMLVLDKLFDEISESDRQDFGKKPRHAGNYDMGPARLSLMAHISFTRAVSCLSKFHGFSPKIREIFHTTIRTLVTNTRLLSTLHGRKRQFFDKLTSETFKQAYSYIPQAIVSDHTKFDTLIPLDEWSRGFAWFLSESHDSLFFEVDEDKVEPFALKFREFEETPLIFNEGSFIRDRQLVIPLEVKVGVNNWYELKELKI
jgi:uracil-DNA glycosylase family 4